MEYDSYNGIIENKSIIDMNIINSEFKLPDTIYMDGGSIVNSNISGNSPIVLVLNGTIISNSNMLDKLIIHNSNDFLITNSDMLNLTILDTNGIGEVNNSVTLEISIDNSPYINLLNMNLLDLYINSSYGITINLNNLLGNIILENVDYSEFCYNTNSTIFSIDNESTNNYICNNEYVNLTIEGDNNNFSDNVGKNVVFTPESEGNYFPISNEQNIIIDDGNNDIEVVVTKGYQKEYEQDDLHKISIDVLGIILVTIRVLIPLIILVSLLFSIIKGAIRKLKGGTFFPK